MAPQEPLPAVGYALDDGELLRCCICADDSMRDPLLLDCLHSCCALHAQAAAAASSPLLCTTCKEETPLCGSELQQVQQQRFNCFLAGRLRRRQFLSGRATCDGCAPARDEPSNFPLPADVAEGALGGGGGSRIAGEVAYLCQTCRALLCYSCMLQHERRYGQHFVSDIGDADLALMSAPTCWLHSLPYDRLCSTCKKPKCVQCAQVCAGDGHVLESEADAAAGKLAEEARQQLTYVESCLRARDFRLECQELVYRLILKRDAQKAKQRANKAAVLQVLERAFKACDEALENCYDELLGRAYELVDEIELLHRKLRQALGYTAALQQPAEEASLLMQQCQLDARLRHLEDEASKALSSMGAVAARVVTIKTDRPEKETWDNVLQSWIGVPTMAPVPEFDLSKHFQTSLPCYDIALVEGGRVLLAALQEGMKEYDTRSGKELSCWKPPVAFPVQDGVQTVDALDDGRVFAGLSGRPHVALLRRSGDAPAASWREESRVTAMQSPPFHLSVLSDLLAVVEGELSGEYVCPGRQLVLISVSRNKQLRRITLEYEACCVAATASGVVAASDERVDSHYLVVCYNQQGQWLWTAHFDDYVTDVCFSWLGRVLYVAECGSKTVFALCGLEREKRKALAAVAASALRGQPCRLSSSKGLLDPLLAVLSKDRLTVTVFHCHSFRVAVAAATTAPTAVLAGE